MSSPVLTLQDIQLTFGGTQLLEGAELFISQGERLCLVGRNGCGKSTLLKIAGGQVEPDFGRRFLQPGATVQYLPQDPDLAAFNTLMNYVEAGLGPQDDRHRAKQMLEQLGLDANRSPVGLSGGEKRRAAIVRVLSSEPDVLLLDEPTNHLDLPAIEWLEGALSALKSAMVLISHDRRFLERLSRQTVWLDRGKTKNLNQGFAGFESWRDKLFEEEEVSLQKLGRKIAMEEDWLRYGVTARRKRNVKRLGNLHALRAKRVENIREQARGRATVQMKGHEGAQSGKLVTEAEKISKSFGAEPIIKELSFRILRGDRVGIVGPNGSGKTTLLKLITGQISPDQGTIRLGTNLDIAALDQGREMLEPSATLLDALTEGGSDMIQLASGPKHVRSYMKDFLFSPEQARTPIGRLSGGEQGRLMLAKALAKPSNLLVLDEPTNDLDLETLDLLQEMFGDYSGTVLLVSHDRDFIDRVVTSIIHFEGHGRWVEYAGGYSDLAAQRKGGGSNVTKGTGLTNPKSKSKPPATEAASAPAKRKLSYKEKYALETIPARIDELHVEMEEYQSSLGDPALFSRDPKAFDETTDLMAKAQSELEGLEEKWLELELLREELEGKQDMNSRKN